MTVTFALRGRLPGVYCHPALPGVVDARIRLDVAGFVGFAERGPVDEPQVVESIADFEAIFGGDLALALDEHGVPTYAALPDAVRSFFDNGGRRAHVVRVVGGGAVSGVIVGRVDSRTPVAPGEAVVGLSLAERDPWPASPRDGMWFAAASVGRWSRPFSVEAAVTDTPLTLQTANDGIRRITAIAQRLVEPGDLVRVRRNGVWTDRWVTESEPLPIEGWHDDDVLIRLRVELSVVRASTTERTTVERFTDLRLGPSSRRSRSRSWCDVVQQIDGGFDPDRSMFLRAAGSYLVPVYGDPNAALQPAPDPEAAAEFTPEALASEGLADFRPRSNRHL